MNAYAHEHIDILESLKTNIRVHEEKQKEIQKRIMLNYVFFSRSLNFRYRKTSPSKFKNHSSGGRKEEKA